MRLADFVRLHYSKNGIPSPKTDRELMFHLLTEVKQAEELVHKDVRLHRQAIEQYEHDIGLHEIGRKMFELREQLKKIENTYKQKQMMVEHQKKQQMGLNHLESMYYAFSNMITLINSRDTPYEQKIIPEHVLAVLPLLDTLYFPDSGSDGN